MCDDDAVRWHGELLSGGMTRRDIRNAVLSGALRRLRHGVYADHDSCPDVVTAAMHGGGLGCVSAAAHAGLATLDDGQTHVWLRHGGHRRVHSDCSCVEHWDQGAPATFLHTPHMARVLWQIHRCLGDEAFFVSLESALHLGRVGTSELRWLRRWTEAPAATLIDAAGASSESVLESLIRCRLLRLGISMRSQVRVYGVGRVDFLIGGRLILEVDGRLGHDDPTSRAKDLRRDANAASWGYVTLRFDYATVMHDWDLVERAIVAQIRLGRHLDVSR